SCHSGVLSASRESKRPGPLGPVSVTITSHATLAAVRAGAGWSGGSRPQGTVPKACQLCADRAGCFPGAHGSGGSPHVCRGSAAGARGPHRGGATWPRTVRERDRFPVRGGTREAGGHVQSPAAERRSPMPAFREIPRRLANRRALVAVLFGA